MFNGETDDLENVNEINEEVESSENTAPKLAPLPPFDITQGESFILYDSMKYVCDTDLCNRSMIKMESGNVCKGYRIKETKPIKIGGDAGNELPEEEPSTFEDSELENPEYDDEGFDDVGYDEGEEGDFDPGFEDPE